MDGIAGTYASVIQSIICFLFRPLFHKILKLIDHICAIIRTRPLIADTQTIHLVTYMGVIWHYIQNINSLKNAVRGIW